MHHHHMTASLYQHITTWPRQHTTFIPQPSPLDYSDTTTPHTTPTNHYTTTEWMSSSLDGGCPGVQNTWVNAYSSQPSIGLVCMDEGAGLLLRTPECRLQTRTEGSRTSCVLTPETHTQNYITTSLLFRQYVTCHRPTYLVHTAHYTPPTTHYTLSAVRRVRIGVPGVESGCGYGSGCRVLSAGCVG